MLFARCRIGFGHGSSSGGGGISKEQTCHGYQLINSFGSFLVVMALLLDVTFSRLLDLDALLSMAPSMSMLTRASADSLREAKVAWVSADGRLCFPLLVLASMISVLELGYYSIVCLVIVDW